MTVTAAMRHVKNTSKLPDDESLEHLQTGEVLLIDKDITLTANRTVRAGVGLQSLSRGVVKTAGYVLTFKGIVPDELRQIFDITGGGSVSFVDSANTRIRPEWFGAVGDGSADDAAALTAAATSAQAASLQLHLSAGAVYNINSNVTLGTSLLLSGTGRIRPASGYTCTVSGHIISPARAYLFDVTHGGAFTLSKALAYVTWFGAVGDGTTDDSAAFTNAITAVGASGTILTPKSFSVDSASEAAITSEGGTTVTAEDYTAVAIRLHPQVAVVAGASAVDLLADPHQASVRLPAATTLRGVCVDMTDTPMITGTMTITVALDGVTAQTITVTSSNSAGAHNEEIYNLFAYSAPAGSRWSATAALSASADPDPADVSVTLLLAVVA